MLTCAQKKYLYAIYKLGALSPRVSSTKVSDIVGVSKASTVKMTKRLCEDGYIIKEPYGRITLTDIGVREANAIYTNSLIVRDFLINRVGVGEDNADKDSVIMAAQLTEETIEKLTDMALGGKDA